MLHLGCSITVAIAQGNHRAESTGEIVLSLYIRAKIETSDVDTLGTMPTSVTHRNHQQT